MSLAHIVGVFNIFVGLMLTVSVLCMGVGTVLWFTRLGAWPSYRDEAFEYMRWSIGILFVLLILLFIVQFLQRHAKAAAFVVGVIIVLAVAWLAAKAFAAEGEEKSEH